MVFSRPFNAAAHRPTGAYSAALVGPNKPRVGTPAAWVIGLKFARRYAVPLAVVVAGIVLALSAKVPPGTLTGGLPSLVPVMPVFTLDALVRVALPLFVITMASQNLPGLAVMRANGFEVNPAPQLVITGLGSVVTGLFGGQTVNLAAITAAIAAGPEAHPDPKMRWIAPIAAGLTYLVLAMIAGVAASFIRVSPPILIEAVAGLALMTSLAAALGGALRHEADRLPAIVTFATTASGIIIGGIGAAFWGLVAGVVLMLFLKTTKPKEA